jgi:hypothetical protein
MRDRSVLFLLTAALAAADYDLLVPAAKDATGSRS